MVKLDLMLQIINQNHRQAVNQRKKKLKNNRINKTWVMWKNNYKIS